MSMYNMLFGTNPDKMPVAHRFYLCSPQEVWQGLPILLSVNQLFCSLFDRYLSLGWERGSLLIHQNLLQIKAWMYEGETLGFHWPRIRSQLRF